MTFTEIVIPAITALVGGVIGAALQFKLGTRKQDESEFSTLVDKYKELYDVTKKELDFLKKEVAFLREKSVEKEKEVEQLRNQLMIFESSHADVPVPIWLKDINGKMLFMNSEFERVVLNPVGLGIKDYLGKTDADVWGEEAAKMYRKTDLQVGAKRKALEFVEGWQGKECYYRAKTLKYPRFLGKTVIGIGGIILDVECIHNNPDIDENRSNS